MLRYFLTILATGAAIYLSGQNRSNDTTFIFKDYVDGELQSIFIDNTSESKYYNDIACFQFLHFDKESYKNSTDYLKEQNLTLHKKSPVIPQTNWITLKQYKEKYYVYHPCDFLFHFRQSINDTTFIDWTGEGPVANQIVEQKKIDKSTYELKLTGIYFKNRTLIIHIIDSKKGIAVFEQITPDEEKIFYLMIADSKIRSVPIIVNHCPTQKQMELDFENPDFKKLLVVHAKRKKIK